MTEKLQQLIIIAKQKMQKCTDPTHDFDHTKRVVSYTEQIQKQFTLTDKQRQAVILAAWWHDVGRTIKKNPSYIWLAFIDDIISAAMLWKETLSTGLFGRVVGLSVRTIICKNMGTGAIFTRLLLRSKDRLLVNIVKDADSLDMFNLERHRKLYLIIENRKIYNVAYRTMNWWFFTLRRLKLKTSAAKEIFRQIMDEFLVFIKRLDIFSWHKKNFGYVWASKNQQRIEKLVFKIQCTA